MPSDRDIQIMYVMVENVTLKLKRVGNPTGYVNITITDSNTINNLTTSSLLLSSIDTSFENRTFDLPNTQVYMQNTPYYNIYVQVNGVDNANYLEVGTTNITNLFYGNLYSYNKTNGESKLVGEETDLLFKYSLIDGGIEKIGLNCSSSELGLFDKGTCIIVDFGFFYFFAGLILIGGGIIVAKFIL
jgi:hypothetical protein